MTRAQCLLIIIGDPNTLKLDKNWRQVLDDFKQAGVCTGVKFTTQKQKKQQRKPLKTQSGQKITNQENLRTTSPKTVKRSEQNSRRYTIDRNLMRSVEEVITLSKLLPKKTSTKTDRVLKDIIDLDPDEGVADTSKSSSDIDLNVYPDRSLTNLAKVINGN